MLTSKASTAACARMSCSTTAVTGFTRCSQTRLLPVGGALHRAHIGPAVLVDFRLMGPTSRASTIASRHARCAAQASGTEGGEDRTADPAAGGEEREYYDFRDMPPLPSSVSRISVPALGHVVYDKASSGGNRMASLAIFNDIAKDDQYNCTLNRRSAITALCMFDKDDVESAEQRKGAFPNIDLLQRIYKEGLSVKFVVEES